MIYKLQETHTDESYTTFYSVWREDNCLGENFLLLDALWKLAYDMRSYDDCKFHGFHNEYLTTYSKDYIVNTLIPSYA